MLTSMSPIMLTKLSLVQNILLKVRAIVTTIAAIKNPLFCFLSEIL